MACKCESQNLHFELLFSYIRGSGTKKVWSLSWRIFSYRSGKRHTYGDIAGVPGQSMYVVGGKMTMDSEF